MYLKFGFINNNMKNYKTVACVAPFSSLFIHSANKTYPCCAYNHNANTRRDQSQDVIWNFHNANKHIREEFKSKGTDISLYNNCFTCSSRATSAQYIDQNLEANPNIDYLENPTLSNLHIKFSNQCNLACRICESGCSNLLFNEDKILVRDKIRKDGCATLESSLDPESVLSKSFKDNLKDLNTLYFSGGEPLLHEQVWELLKAANDQGYSKNISLKFNTNGTIKLNQEKYDILKGFKQVYMFISMDGVGKHAEYIRTNVNWERWVENLRAYKAEFENHSSMQLAGVITVSAYNVHIIDKVKEFFANENILANLNFVHNPPELSIYNLRDDVKEYIIDKYSNALKSEHDFYYYEIIEFINNPSTIHPDLVHDYIDKKDNIVLKNNLYKNYTAFRDVDPEWFNRLKG